MEQETYLRIPIMIQVRIKRNRNKFTIMKTKITMLFVVFLEIFYIYCSYSQEYKEYPILNDKKEVIYVVKQWEYIDKKRQKVIVANFDFSGLLDNKKELKVYESKEYGIIQGKFGYELPWYEHGICLYDMENTDSYQCLIFPCESIDCDPDKDGPDCDLCYRGEFYFRVPKKRDSIEIMCYYLKVFPWSEYGSKWNINFKIFMPCTDTAYSKLRLEFYSRYNAMEYKLLKYGKFYSFTPNLAVISPICFDDEKKDMNFYDDTKKRIIIPYNFSSMYITEDCKNFIWIIEKYKRQRYEQLLLHIPVKK